MRMQYLSAHDLDDYGYGGVGGYHSRADSDGSLSLGAHLDSVDLYTQGHGAAALNSPRSIFHTIGGRDASGRAPHAGGFNMQHQQQQQQHQAATMQQYSKGYDSVQRDVPLRKLVGINAVERHHQVQYEQQQQQQLRHHHQQQQHLSHHNGWATSYHSP
ncbi:hypothetical protein JKP88DRAFT_231169 [Tribonema minus]|uniref:Uncharacterized protein n=1 Tax=Tribonema minus TaxID=303371 RepID=A0A835ZD12_9STRA|nr:hypothetical protein JKP88DRAFT_231169 [Tribonema minus]